MIFKDTSGFCEAANHFRKYGYYTDAPIDTVEYNQYWDEQTDRCLNGFKYKGIKITGDHYFYLNFTRMDLTEEIQTKKGVIKGVTKEDFPAFWDGDYTYYWVLEIAKNGISLEDYEKLQLDVKIKPTHLDGGRHVLVLKTRRRGYSYKNSGLAVKQYSLHRKSKNFIAAFSKELYGTIVSITIRNLNFLNEHTGFAKTRDQVDKLTNDNFNVRASFLHTMPDGKKIEKGYLSEIKAISFKDDPSALRGKKAQLILFEEAGSFNNLKAAWQVTKPSVEDGIYTIGQMIAFGTGGDMDNGTDFAEMFYDPEPYNVLPVENTWDEGKEGSYVGYFAPDYINKVGFMNKNGVSDQLAARTYEETQREKAKKARDGNVYPKHIAEYPFCPAEAVLRVNSNKFPTRELSNILSRIETNPKIRNAEFNGWIDVGENGKLEFVSDTGINPIRNFPLKNTDDHTGCITIYEHPYQTHDDRVPHGMYVIGTDPVAMDDAPWSESLNSSFVLNTVTNRIVAEYSGRPSSTKIYYENLRKLAKYYNAMILYENQVKGLEDYFEERNESFILAEPPRILGTIIDFGRTNRKKGCHMSTGIKNHMIDTINNWLRDDATDGFQNMHFIRSEALLKELIAYTKDLNVDRVFALGMTLMLAADMRNKIEETNNPIRLNHQKDFFNKRIFLKKPQFTL